MKNCKRHLLLFSFLVFSSLGFSQVKGKVTKDSVNNLKIFNARINLLETNLSTYNLSAYEAGIGFSFQPGNSLFFSGGFTYGIGDMLYPNTTDGNDPVKSNEMVSEFESSHSNFGSFEATFFFRQKLIKKDLKVNLYKLRKLRKTKGYYSLINGSKLNRIGLRAGVKKGITWYAWDKKATVSGVALGSPSTTPEEFSYKSMTDMLQYTHVSLGICISELTNLHVDLEDLGSRKNSTLNFMYLEAVYALQSDLDDVYVGKTLVGDTLYYQKYNINDYTPKSKIGFNLGYRIFPSSGNGFGYLAETGYFPAVKKGLNFYLRLGISYYLGNKP